MALTDEQREARRAALTKGRETAAANRAQKAMAGAMTPETLESVQVNFADPNIAIMPPIEHDGDRAPPAISEPAVDEPGEGADDFERFLASQDAETRSVLSDVELRVIYEVETKRAADERKAALKKTVATRALRHARATAGLIPAEAVAAQSLRDRMNQKVSWIINMPEAGNSGTLIDQGVRIDGRLYVHGETVTGTLAEYISYREIEGRAHENERQFQGRSRMSKLAQSGMRFLNNEGRA